MAIIDNPRIITLEELRLLALRAIGLINAIYLHWTAGRYNQCFDDYHLNIGKNGEIYLTCDELTDLKAHTWHRNSGASGVTLCCGFQAEAGYQKSNAPPNIDFGPYPPTQAQIETMAQVIAVISHGLGLEISYDTVKTHAEAAIEDGYGPYGEDPDLRWDLWYIPDLPSTFSLKPGGEVLRGKALWYSALLPADEVKTFAFFRGMQ